MANRGPNKSELEKLQEAFYNFDEEKTGYLSIDDLRYIVTTDGNPLSGQDLEEFLAEADIYKNGVVDYKAFAQILMSEDMD